MFEGIYSNNLWSFGRGMKAAVLPVRPRFAVNTADAAIEAALASAGITHVLSYQVAEAVVCGALRLILRPYEPELLPVHIVYAAQTLMPLKLRAFLDFAGPRLKASIPEIGSPF